MHNVCNSYSIIAYLSDWEQWDEEDIEAGKLTHINYAFAKVQDGIVTASLKKIQLLNDIKRKNPHIKTVISIGGWGADGFSDAALTDESRKVFADSAIKFMIENNFDGIDIDWEYPCCDLAEIKARPEDKDNFTYLLKLIREKMDDLEKKEGKHYILSIAVGAADEYLENIDVEVIHNYLDFINVMTYDMRGSFTNTTGHHANVLSPKFDADGISADSSIQKLIGRKVPNSKIVLGAAFYGRMWKEVEGGETGLNQMAKTTGCEMCSFSELTDKYINKNNFKRYWDEHSKAPYLFDGNTFISYEDGESLKHKAYYTKDKKLAGIMFWEYSLDKTGELLNVIYDTFNHDS